MRAYYLANKTRLNEYSKAWRAANPDKRRANKARYYETHKVAVNDAAKQWALSNPDRVQANRKRQRAENPDYFTAAWHRRRAGGSISKQGVRDVKQMCDGVCSYCFKPARTIDHVVPVARGGRSDFDNLTLACSRCNSSKNSRTPLEWVFNLPRLGAKTDACR